MVSQNHGILFTAFLVPSDQEDADSYRQNPNYAIMASQEDTDENASAFANRLIGDLVPQDFLRTLCSQAPGALAAGAVVADFGHGRYTVFAFNDGPFHQIKDLPKLNVALSIAPQAVSDPRTLPIVAAGQVVYHLMRSLRSPHAAIYVKTTPLLNWTLDSNMPTSISQVSRISRVYNADNHYSVDPSPSEPAQQGPMVPKAASVRVAAKSVATKPPAQRARATKVSREALQLGEKTEFNKEESACLEQAFLENFEGDGETEPATKKTKTDVIEADVVVAKPAAKTKQAKVTDKKPPAKTMELKAPATKLATKTKETRASHQKAESKPKETKESANQKAESKPRETKESAKKQAPIATKTNIDHKKRAATKKGEDPAMPDGTGKALTQKEMKVLENAEKRSTEKSPPEHSDASSNVKIETAAKKGSKKKQDISEPKKTAESEKAIVAVTPTKKSSSKSATEATTVKKSASKKLRKKDSAEETPTTPTKSTKKKHTDNNAEKEKETPNKAPVKKPDSDDDSDSSSDDSDDEPEIPPAKNKKGKKAAAGQPKKETGTEKVRKFK